MKLQEFFEQNPLCALGFSGGVDSSFLLYAGLMYGAEIRPYYIRSQFQPRFEFEDAKRLSDSLGAPMTVITLDALSDREVADNPFDRCYHCKRRLFGTLQKQALSDGFKILIDGTNASDDEGDRPGMKALKELSVRSPLKECGLDKEEIRRLSKEAGLFTWDKPSYACLATRIPTGTPLTAELLNKVEKAEEALFKLGYTDFRVRVYAGAARLQLRFDQSIKAVGESERILEKLKPYFETVLLDLRWR